MPKNEAPFQPQRVILVRWSEAEGDVTTPTPLAKLEPILAAALAFVRSIRDNLPIEGEANVFGTALTGGGWQGQQLVYRQAGHLCDLLQAELRHADSNALIAPLASDDANLAITRLVVSLQAFREWGRKVARAKTRLPTLPRALFAKLEKSTTLLHAVVGGLRRASSPQSEEWPIPTTISDQSEEWSIPTTIGDWAKIYGCHRNTMSKRLHKGMIKSKKVGNHYKIAVEDLPANQQLRYRSKQ
jgi:hypothetical protein